MTAPPTAGPSIEVGSVCCAGCGAVVTLDDAPFPTRCPMAVAGDDIDHVLAPTLDLAGVEFVAGDDRNPFVRYRQLLRAWHAARAAGWSDQRYLGLVRGLDDAIAAVDGQGFTVTPFGRWPALSTALGFGASGGVWVKDETGGVGGSHKARHLLGVMLELLVAESRRPDLARRPLAIASCGNAAVAAAVVARAAGRALDVYVPPDADAAVIDRLERLGARIERVARRAGERGDPTVRALEAAVAAGALPFTCQGPQNGLAIEGGETLAFEIAEALARDGVGLDRVIVQVGGGALASALAQGFATARALGAIGTVPRLDTVQTSGAWPLRRAYDRVAASLLDVGLDPGRGPVDLTRPAAAAVLAAAARHRSAAMWPWETEPRSVAHGILDDETYDWFAVVRAMLATGGRPIVVTEAELTGANDIGRSTTGIDADETGTAGLAGVLHLQRDGEVEPGARVGVLFTGIRRRPPVGGSTPTDPPPTRRVPSDLS